MLNTSYGMAASDIILSVTPSPSPGNARMQQQSSGANNHILVGMFNVSYPGAAPNLGRSSMGLSASQGSVEGAHADRTSGTPQTNRADMFTCPICFEELHRDDVFVSSMCGHEMCRGCARQMVLTAIRSALINPDQVLQAFANAPIAYCNTHDCECKP